MIRVGLSVDSAPAMRKASLLFSEAAVACTAVRSSPAADNVAQAISTALRTTAALLDYVETFGVDPARFLDLAQQCEKPSELYTALFEHIKESQKGNAP